MSQSCSLLRSRVLLFVATALLALAASGAQAQGPSLYPTDACVVDKIRASADYCLAAVSAWKRGTPSGLAITRRDAARARLESAWTNAEDRSLAAGVSCADTTGTATEMVASLDDAATAIAAEIATSSGADDGAERRCESRRFTLAAQACRQWIRLEADHLIGRGEWDRDRNILTSVRAGVDDWFESSWSSGAASACEGGPSGADARSLVTDTANDALRQLLVSPKVSTSWTMVTPDAQVPYQGKTLDPICSKGTPWVFFVKRGTVNKTLMYYQGGGACWDYLSCSFPTHKTAAGASDNPANATNGFANLSNPDNPFRDWNAVFVPYCTGDVHWGDAVVDHTQGNLKVTIHHKGFVNAQVAEKWAREHFVDPDQVFVTGSSAGAYGAIVNSYALQEKVWPSSDLAVLGDAGNGVITQDFLENDLAKWGIEQNLPAWIPGLNKPLTELTAADLYTQPALFYPTHRFANYAAAYDGGQGGQVGFYNVMLNPDTPINWVFWWRPTCEWNAAMRSLVQDSASQAANYRYYIASGSRHTMWGNNKVYTDTTGGVPTIVSWIRAMLAGAPEWTNVESSDPGLLLTGDPRPAPIEPPYTSDGRIVCEYGDGPRP